MWPAGTKVVCIDDHFPAWAKQMYAALPKAGNTYTIRGSTVGVGYGPGFSDRQEGEIAVYLREIVNPKSGKAPFREWGFKAERRVCNVYGFHCTLPTHRGRKGDPYRPVAAGQKM